MGWFVEASPLYENTQQKLLSCGIAGAQWGILLLSAYVLLKEKDGILPETLLLEAWRIL